MYEELCNTQTPRCLFEGEDNCLLPKINAEICLSEIIVVIGRMIAHSIGNGYPGFPYLAETCFQYLASGSVKQAAMYVLVKSVASGAYRYYINEVNIFILCFVLLGNHLLDPGLCQRIQ